MTHRIALTLTLTVALIAGCKNHQQPSVDIAPQIAKGRSIEDSLGRKITTITFHVKPTKEDIKTFGDGIIPWISLDSPEKRIKDLLNPNDIVIPYKKVKLMIDYPVAKPFFFDLISQSTGFTRK